MTDFYQQAEQDGGRRGKYVKLTRETPQISGILAGPPIKRPKMFEGLPVVSKAGNPRDEHVITLHTGTHEHDDDDGLRRFTLNEGDFSAFIAAWTEAGKPKPVDGWKIIVKTTKWRTRPTGWDDHSVEFLKYVGVPAPAPGDDEEPF